MKRFIEEKKVIRNYRSSVFAVLTVALALIMLLSACSVTELFSLDLPSDDTPDTGEVQTGGVANMTLAIYSGEQVDPYTSQNRSNRAVISLCYDTLVTLDNAYSPNSLIAEWVADGNRITFILNEDATFSDGSRIRAEDCVYSFKSAASKNSVFASRFENISRYYAESAYVFTVVFKSESRFNINLLNIPVVKSVGKQGGWYIGSGRYFYSYEDGVRLLRGRVDGRYCDGYKLTRIELFETAEPSQLTYYFNYGQIHAAYADLSLGTVRYKGNVELVSFPRLDFVFAVVNGKKEYLADAEISKAISYAIDRKGLCDEVFDGLALPTWHPFCPGWVKTQEAGLSADIYSVQTANSLLMDSGVGFKGTKRAWKKKEITLKIICNTESVTKCEATQYLADCLESIGFTTEVEILTWSNYIKAIENGDFDIYIGETVLAPDMDINGILAKDICNNYRAYPKDEQGISSLDALRDVTLDFYVGDADMRDVVAEFFECQPYIPLYYTEGALAVNRVVDGDFLPNESNIYNLIETWIFE